MWFWTPPGWKEGRLPLAQAMGRVTDSPGRAPVVQSTAAGPRGREAAGSVCATAQGLQFVMNKSTWSGMFCLSLAVSSVIQELSPVSTVCCCPSLLTGVEEGWSLLTVLCYLLPLNHSPTLVFSHHQLMAYSVLAVSVCGFPRTRFSCLANCCCPFLTTPYPCDLYWSCLASSIPAAKPQTSLESRFLCNL